MIGEEKGEQRNENAAMRTAQGIAGREMKKNTRKMMAKIAMKIGIAVLVKLGLLFLGILAVVFFISLLGVSII